MSGSEKVALVSVIASAFVGLAVGFGGPFVTTARERKAEHARWRRDQSRQAYVGVIRAVGALTDNFILAKSLRKNEDWATERGVHSIALFRTLEQEIASVQVFGTPETNRLALAIKSAAVDLGTYIAYIDVDADTEKHDRAIQLIDSLSQQFRASVRRDLGIEGG